MLTREALEAMDWDYDEDSELVLDGTRCIADVFELTCAGACWRPVRNSLWPA